MLKNLLIYSALINVVNLYLNLYVLFNSHMWTLTLQHRDEHQKWHDAVKPYIRCGKTNMKKLYVCSLHFTPSCFYSGQPTILKDGVEVILPKKKQRIKPGPVPSIFHVSIRISKFKSFMFAYQHFPLLFGKIEIIKYLRFLQNSRIYSNVHICAEKNPDNVQY